MIKRKIHKIFKIIVMLLLCAVIVLNSIPSEVMGFVTHIVVGCSFVGLTVIHIALSFRYFASCAKNFLKIKIKAKINFIIDILLIFLCIAIFITGIFLATNYLPSGMEYHDFETLHGLLGAAIVFMIIAHGCLHIKKKKAKSKATKQ